MEKVNDSSVDSSSSTTSSDDEERSDDAEQAMINKGLIYFENAFKFAMAPKQDLNLNMISIDRADFLERGLMAETTQEHQGNVSIEIGDVESAKNEELIRCRSSQSLLLVPFSFWENVDEKSPQTIAKELLKNTLYIKGEKQCLWERLRLPKQAVELSPHLRQLLGFEELENAPVQRLKLTEAARKFLFSSARLWADNRDGQVIGKRCDWLGLYLVIFPHGAILSVLVDWKPKSVPEFSLSALRTWLYTAKFRSMKRNQVHGWTFAMHQTMSEREMTYQKESLGLKLFATLYGGSSISLGSIANWLVRLGDESTAELKKRVNKSDYCQHHSFAILDRGWSPPQSGGHNMLEARSSDTYLWIRPTSVMHMSADGIMQVIALCVILIFV